MRKIDWNEELSDADISWLRQTGIPGMEERIAAHQAQFGAEVPDEEIPKDTVTRSGLDGGVAPPTVEGAGSHPINVTPEAGSAQAGDATDEDEEEADDYDTWPVAELLDELNSRNELNPDRAVQAEGTGSNGKLLKRDLIKALRMYDQQNPQAEDDE